MTSFEDRNNTKDTSVSSKQFSSRTGKAGSPLPGHGLSSQTNRRGFLKTSTANSANSKRPKIEETMLKIATVIAERSTCARRSVGAVLVDKDNRVLSIGHNGPAKGMLHCTNSPCAGAKCPSGTGLDLCEAIHAEQNALMFCPDIMKIDKCFVTTAPCIHCVKMLMNTSCKIIVFNETYPHSGQARELWEQDPSRRWVKV